MMNWANAGISISSQLKLFGENTQPSLKAKKETILVPETYQELKLCELKGIEMRIYTVGAEVLSQYWKTVDSGSLITNVREIALDSLYKAGAEERILLKGTVTWNFLKSSQLSAAWNKLVTQNTCGKKESPPIPRTTSIFINYETLELKKISK